MSINSVILVLVSISAVCTGYLVGHNEGFEFGRKIGKIDAMFKKSGACLYKNGKKVEDGE